MLPLEELPLTLPPIAAAALPDVEESSVDEELLLPQPETNAMLAVTPIVRAKQLAS
jgi:hypothetical protein